METQYKHWHIEQLDTVDSTSLHIKRLLKADASLDMPYCAVADDQTAGRGRRGHEWTSGRGAGLYTSLLFPAACESAISRVIPAAAVAVCEAVERICADAGITCGIKWPNDVILQGRKLSGILAERIAGPRLCVVLGIGINLAQTDADFGPQLCRKACSLSSATGARVERSEMLRALLDSFDAVWASAQGDGAELMDRYRARSVTLGKEVRVQSVSEEFTGVAVQIREDGSLVVQDAHGLHTVLEGDVSVRGINGYV